MLFLRMSRAKRNFKQPSSKTNQPSNTESFDDCRTQGNKKTISAIMFQPPGYFNVKHPERCEKWSKRFDR